MSTYRLFVLGAGFSTGAGMPLANQLFSLVRKIVASAHGSNNWVERDLKRYVRYLQLCDARTIDPSEVNYEDFLGFLDLEHFLSLKGKDTWSEEGNESQLLVRNGIAEVLYGRLPPGAPVPHPYLEFASRLTTSDWVLTFNYDTVLEQALEQVGLPFRLFPFRFSDISEFMNTIDDDKDELVLLKLHGSINWFDRTSFAKHEALSAAGPAPYDPKHAVFGKNRVVTPRPLCDGPRPKEEALSSIFIVDDIGPLFTKPFWQWTPLILAPSTAKLFYSMPLRDFWWGWQRSGGMNLGLAFVGYSLPRNDEHARQMVFHVELHRVRAGS